MSLLDTYYRGFIDYRKITENDKPSKRDRKILAKSDNAFDKFTITKYQITIDEAWVLEIEKGLEFVEKAVKEERQFIRTNGEIVPIEKVKKVSKDSVAHLARHSNMITHLPDNPNDTIVPDSIYMVEKLNDYAVYENRFLYMLLCYLRDFIDLRLQKITDIRMTYICDFELKRETNSKKRTTYFNTIFHEDRKDNPYPIDNESSRSLLKRINNCQEIVLMLLNTNLMTEVSKAPMVKPPIVKTNVLKMNNNFKNSLALYDYIVNYNSDGYTSKEVVTNYVPLTDNTLDELMELPTLTYFLTYKYGNDLIEPLKKAYLEEEEIRRKKEIKALQDQIKRLKKKIEESGTGIEEYILLLEKRNRMLEEDSQQLEKAKIEIIELNKKIDSLNLEIESLNNQILKLNEIIQEKINEIIDLTNKHIEEINLLNENNLQQIQNIKDEYEGKITNLYDSFNAQIVDLSDKHKEEINQIKENYKDSLQKQISEDEELIQNLKNEIESLQSKELELITKNNSELKSLNDEISELNNQKSELINSYENKLHEIENNYLNEIELNKTNYNAEKSKLDSTLKQALYDRDLMAAELRSIRIKNGLITPSEKFTSRERFLELENEFEIFNKFFKAQWKLTKKEIRKKILWSKNEKINTPIDDGGLSNNSSSKLNDEILDNASNESLNDK